MQFIKIMQSEGEALPDPSDQQWQQQGGRRSFSSLFPKTYPWMQ